MKKILLTLVVLLTTALSANAFGDFRLGVTGGYNLTTASFDNSTVKHTLEGKNGSGWFIGPKAYMSLFAGLGVEGAIHYNQREYKMLSGKAELTEKLQSVDVPLNLKLNLTVQKVGVYLATGPQFSYGLGKSKIDVSSLMDKGIYQTNNLTTTWNVGAGVALGGHLDLGIGYNVALNDMSKKGAQSWSCGNGANGFAGLSFEYFQRASHHYF